jgi:dolichol-phosphate hexosyltransferase
MPELSILMPVYNERATVERAIEGALAARMPVGSREVVVVDDGSTDGTRELLREREWPLRTALGEASGTYVAVLDADLEYDPADIARLLPPLIDRRADAVFGIRGFASHSSYSFWYVIGNKAVTLAANVLFNSWLDDIMTCHKAMPTELFRSLGLRSGGFEIEGEIAARLLARGYRVFEVPISYQARGREEGKKLTARDGLRVIATLVRCRLDAKPPRSPARRG